MCTSSIKLKMIVHILCRKLAKAKITSISYKMFYCYHGSIFVVHIARKIVFFFLQSESLPLPFDKKEEQNYMSVPN